MLSQDSPTPRELVAVVSGARRWTTRMLASCRHRFVRMCVCVSFFGVNFRGTLAGRFRIKPVRAFVSLIFYFYSVLGDQHMIGTLTLVLLFWGKHSR